MTPAERAREIDRLEFEAECQQARELARRYTEQCRRQEQAKLNAYFNRPMPEAQRPCNKPGKPAKRYTFQGQSKTITEWAEVAGTSYRTLLARVRSGMPFDKAMTMKPKQRAAVHDINGVSKTLAEWAAFAGINYLALLSRMRSGRSLADAITMSRPLPDHRGVVSNLEPFKGTGAGSTAQDFPEFSKKLEPAE